MPVLKRIFRACLAPCLALSTTAVLAANPHPAAPAPAIEDSVVKIFATVRHPDPFKPWTKQGPTDVTASGVVIDGKRILTNAHVVLYATQVQIQANAAGDKVPATVIAVAPGIDLAVLQLDDASFFDTHPAIERASELPQIKDTVLAYGFPTGGSSLSITKGIVSRIEFVPYNFPVSGLRIQVDAAINPGNSGGPAIAGDKMIGLAFSKLVGGETQSIGYIIPNEEVDLFLQDIADGHYDGKPAMYDDLQTLENPALRDYLKLDKSVEGMVVHRPYKDDAAYPLKEWDVITRIGDTPIDNQGMVRLGKDLRVSFGYLIQKKARQRRAAADVGACGQSAQGAAAGVHGASVADRRSARLLSAVLHLRAAGVLQGHLADGRRSRKQRRHVAGAWLREEPAHHPRSRSAGCGPRGARGGLLSVLPAQALHRLFQSRTARSIGASVVTANLGDFAAIQRLESFDLTPP